MKAAAVILKWLGCTGKTGEEVFYIGGGESLPAPFSPQEERMWLEKHAKGSAQARSMLIEHNLRLVVYIAKRFENTPVTLEDLISIGTIGLIKAVNTYNMDRKIKLATYASRCIENEILMYYRSKKKTKSDVSLFEPIGTDKEGNQIQLMDVIENDDIDVSNNILKNESIDKLNKYIKEVLSEREYYILVQRYGLLGHEEMTQRQIAKILGISRSYVSRIEKRALDKLKKVLEF